MLNKDKKEIETPTIYKKIPPFFNPMLLKSQSFEEKKEIPFIGRR